jgi:hypothetical protein
MFLLGCFWELLYRSSQFPSLNDLQHITTFLGFEELYLNTYTLHTHNADGPRKHIRYIYLDSYMMVQHVYYMLIIRISIAILAHDGPGSFGCMGVTCFSRL